MATRTIDMKLDVDTKKGTAAIKKAKTATSNFSKSSVNDAKKVSKAWDKAGKSFKKMSIMVTAGVASFAYLAKKSLDAADKIAKLSDSIGISTIKLQEYNYAAGLSGVSTEELASGLVAFTKRVGESKTEVGALSGYLKNSNKALLDQLKSVDNVSQGLDILMKALAGTENSTDAVALSSAAFGRGPGAKLLLMVKDGAVAFDAMKKEAHDLGLILDLELLRNAERLNDDMSKLSQVVSTQFTKAILELAPEIEKAAKFMLEWVKANKELISQKTEETIDGITTSIKSLIKIYDDLPSGVVGATGTGLLLRMIGLPPRIIALATAIYLLNHGLKEMAGHLDKLAQDAHKRKYGYEELKIRPKDSKKPTLEIVKERLALEKNLGNAIKLRDRAEQRGDTAAVARHNKRIDKYKQSIKAMNEVFSPTVKLTEAEGEVALAAFIASEKGVAPPKKDADRIATAEAWATYKYDLDQRMLNATGQTQEAELNILKQKMATEIAEYGKTEDKITKIKEVFTAEKKVIDNKYTAQHADNLQKNADLAQQLSDQHADNLQKSVDLAQSISDQTITIYGNMYDQISLGLDQSSTGLQTWGELWVDIGQKMNDQLAGAFTDNLWDVIEGTKNGEEAFKAFGKTVISWLSKAIIKQTMLYLLDKTGMDDRKKALIDKLVANKVEAKSVDDLTAAYIRLNIAKGIGSLFGGGAASSGGGVASSGNTIGVSAKGNVYNQGGMAAYANGGVVSTPTNFAFGNGNIGLLGEAGSEAIMPLSRTSGGELGVKTTGQQQQSQQPNQTVIINAVDTKSFADALQRNPAGIISIVNEALQDRGPILDTIRQTL